MKEKYENMLQAFKGNYQYGSCELYQLIHVRESWNEDNYGDCHQVRNRWFGIGYHYYSSHNTGGTLQIKSLLGGLPRWADIATAMFKVDTAFAELNQAMLNFGKGRLPSRLGKTKDNCGRVYDCCLWKIIEDTGMSGRRDLRLIARDDEYRLFGMPGRMLSKLHVTGSGGIEGSIPISDFPCYAAALGDVDIIQSLSSSYNIELVEWDPGSDTMAWDDNGKTVWDWTSCDNIETPF